MRYGLLLFFVTTINSCFSQDIKATWFLDENRFIKFENDQTVQYEPFDFIKGYEISGNNIVFKHQGTSIPDSKFLILKLTTDSLFLIPINNSAKAISAKLKRQFYESIEKIEKNPEASDISYFKVIKFYNASTLYESIKWDTLTLSHAQTGYWGVNYFDIKILNSGQFYAIERYVPFEINESNKAEKTKTIYYEDKLPVEMLEVINSELNGSGLRRIDKIDFKGWSSHGRQITLKVRMSDQTKLLTAYEYCFPETLKSLVKRISDIERDNTFKTTDREFTIETSFINQHN